MLPRFRGLYIQEGPCILPFMELGPQNPIRGGLWGPDSRMVVWTLWVYIHIHNVVSTSSLNPIATLSCPHSRKYHAYTTYRHFKYMNLEVAGLRTLLNPKIPKSLNPTPPMGLGSLLNACLQRSAVHGTRLVYSRRDEGLCRVGFWLLFYRWFRGLV